VNSLKGSIALLCTVGIFATATGAFADQISEHQSDTNGTKSDSLTSSILSFFGQSVEKKEVGPEVILLEKPSKENSGNYITLTEPSPDLAPKEPENKLTVSQSFTVKPSLIFNMGASGSTTSIPSGLSSRRATTTGNRLTFSYGKNQAFRDPNTVDVSIGSHFLIEPTSALSPLYENSDLGQIYNRQVYNLSLDVGYAGFSIGASYSKEKMLHDSGLSGFDVGFGYNGLNWGADVKFGEYTRERDLLFSSTEDFFNTVYALEIGGSYQIRSNIRFTGRFTYYAYGQDNDLDELRNSQVFFLGTNVNF